MTSPGLDYLNSLALWDGKRLFGLETPTKLLRALGDPQNAVPSIHVAGTNGKGSVCAMLSAILIDAGFSVGQFTSPHLSAPTERCIINGFPVSEELFDSALQKVKIAAEENELNPSFFEVVCAAAFLEFSRQKLDWQVIEVGLGGRLDATNTMRSPQVSVITSIDFDHMHILGESLAEISMEKAGIFKPDVKVFVGRVDADVEQVLRTEAKSVGAPIEFVRALDPNRKTSLLGAHQKANAELAALVANELGLEPAQIAHGLARVRWPGRLEVLECEAPILLDAAHNPAGIENLLSFLEEFVEERGFLRVSWVLSFLERKKWIRMTELIRKHAEKLSAGGIRSDFFFTDSGAATAVSPDQIQWQFGAGSVFEQPEAALEAARGSTSSSGLIVISGSIYLIGRLRPQIVERPFCTIE